MSDRRCDCPKHGTTAYLCAKHQPEAVRHFYDNEINGDRWAYPECATCNPELAPALPLTTEGDQP